MKITLCIDKQDRNNSSSELRQYSIDIGCPLRSYEEVFDELKISTNDNNKLVGVIYRRCYVDKYGVLKKLDSEEIQELEIPEITLFEGTNYVYIQEFTNLNMKIEYLTNAEMNKYFATKAEMNSTIKQTYDSILLAVSTKADKTELETAISLLTNEIELRVIKDKIISAINMSPETITILANRLGLTANDVLDIIAGNEINLTSKNISIKSNNFSVDKNGKINSTSGKIGGFNIGEYALAADINDKYSYTIDDAQRATSIANGEITPTKDDYDKLDVNKDGVIDKRDATIILRKYYGYTSTQGSFSIDTTDANDIIIFTGNATQNLYTSLGMERITTSEFVVKNISTLGDDHVSNTQIDDNGITTPTVTQTSKEEKKKNFEKLENALNIIKNTDIYKYNLKSQTDDDKKHIGFVIGKNYKYSKEITSVDKSGNEIGADLYSFVSVCCKAIQEQQEQIEELENRIKKLEGDK